MWGTVAAGLAVAFGAFGAHGLKDKLEPEEIEVFKTAVQYQMYHAIALIFTGMMLKSKPSKNLANAAVCFLLGIILFSGSLYLMTLARLGTGNLDWLGPITPIGGASFLIGWGLMVYHQVSKR